MLERLKYGWKRGGRYKKEVYEIIDEIKGDGYKIKPDLIPKTKLIKKIMKLYGDDVRGWIPLKTGQVIPLPLKLLQRHLIIIGTTGSGKTVIMTHILRSITETLGRNDKVIIFDPKGGYRRMLSNLGYNDVVAISEDPGLATTTWNVFEDIMYGVDIDSLSRVLRNDAIEEIARMIEEGREDDITIEMIERAARHFSSSSKLALPLMRDMIFRIGVISSQIVESRSLAYREHGSGDQVYFTRDAPLSMMKALLTSILLQAMETQDTSLLSNKAIVEYANMDIDSIRRLFKGYGLVEALEHISIDSPQTQGVMSMFRKYINDLFVYKFGEEGDFGVRRFLREDGRGILLLEYRLDREPMILPIFSTIITIAMMEILGGEVADRQTFFFIDEFHALPKLRSMGTFMNMSRELGGSIIAATQSFAQLSKNYGEAGARSIISAFNTRIFLRVLDKESIGLFNENVSVRVFKKLETKSTSYPYTMDPISQRSNTSKSIQYVSNRTNIHPGLLMSLNPGLGFFIAGGIDPFIAPISLDYFRDEKILRYKV